MWVAEAAPLRALTPEVMAKPLHAFKAKKAPGDWSRGYGRAPVDHLGRRPHRRADRVLVLPQGRVARDAVRQGRTRQRLEGGGRAPPAPGTTRPSTSSAADPKLADAAEATARAKAREKKAAAEREKAAAKDKPAAGAAQDKPAAAEPAAEEEEDEEEAASGKPDSARPLLDAELETLLADPLRSTRKRYLPPGKYTVEVRSGSAVSTTTLTVTPPKDRRGSEDRP